MSLESELRAIREQRAREEALAIKLAEQERKSSENEKRGAEDARIRELSLAIEKRREEIRQCVAPLSGLVERGLRVLARETWGRKFGLRFITNPPEIFGDRFVRRVQSRALVIERPERLGQWRVGLYHVSDWSKQYYTGVKMWTDTDIDRDPVRGHYCQTEIELHLINLMHQGETTYFEVPPRPGFNLGERPELGPIITDDVSERELEKLLVREFELGPRRETIHPIFTPYVPSGDHYYRQPPPIDVKIVNR